MGRYLSLWEVIQSRSSTDVKERVTGANLLLEMVKKDLKSGTLKDWGGFVGESNGFAIWEGNEVEVHKACIKYAPYVMFKLHGVASLGQIEEVFKPKSG